MACRCLGISHLTFGVAVVELMLCYLILNAVGTMAAFPFLNLMISKEYIAIVVQNVTFLWIAISILTISGVLKKRRILLIPSIIFRVLLFALFVYSVVHRVMQEEKAEKDKQTQPTLLDILSLAKLPKPEDAATFEQPDQPFELPELPFEFPPDFPFNPPPLPELPPISEILDMPELPSALALLPLPEAKPPPLSFLPPLPRPKKPPAFRAKLYFIWSWVLVIQLAHFLITAICMWRMKRNRDLKVRDSISDWSKLYIAAYVLVFIEVAIQIAGGILVAYKLHDQFAEKENVGPVETPKTTLSIFVESPFICGLVFTVFLAIAVLNRSRNLLSVHFLGSFLFIVVAIIHGFNEISTKVATKESENYVFDMAFYAMVCIVLPWKLLMVIFDIFLAAKISKEKRKEDYERYELPTTFGQNSKL